MRAWRKSRRAVCACTHYPVFKEPTNPCARGTRPRSLRRRPRLGEPSKVTRTANLCQPLHEQELAIERKLAFCPSLETPAKEYCSGRDFGDRTSKEYRVLAPNRQLNRTQCSVQTLQSSAVQRAGSPLQTSGRARRMLWNACTTHRIGPRLWRTGSPRERSRQRRRSNVPASSRNVL